MRTEHPRASASQSYSPQEFLSTPPPCDLGCHADHVDQRRICFHFYSSKKILVGTAEASWPMAGAGGQGRPEERVNPRPHQPSLTPPGL